MNMIDLAAVMTAAERNAWAAKIREALASGQVATADRVRYHEVLLYMALRNA